MLRSSSKRPTERASRYYESLAILLINDNFVSMNASSLFKSRSGANGYLRNDTPDATTSTPGGVRSIVELSCLAPHLSTLSFNHLLLTQVLSLLDLSKLHCCRPCASCRRHTAPLPNVASLKAHPPPL